MDLAPIPNVAFAGSACFGCYRSPPQVAPLKRCSGCKRIKFCSPECSKAEWPDHKSFCRAFSAVRTRAHALLPPLYNLTPDTLASRRETHRAQFFLEDELLTAGLGREQTLLEGKLLWREPRCGVCWDREADAEGREGEDAKKGWRVCDKCRVVGWCCDAHEAEGQEDHMLTEGPDGRTQCQTIQLSNEVDEFHLRHHLASPDAPPNLWVPARLLTASSKPPTSWAEYLLPSLLPSPPPPLAQIHGVFLEALSPVLTIFSSLPSSARRTPQLSIHIIDPSIAYTGLYIPAFEELLHLLPGVQDLSLSLIGPNVPGSLASAQPTQPTCDECRKLGRSRTVQWIPLPAYDPELPLPSFVVAFSPSMSTAMPYWQPIIEHIVKHKLTAVFTAKTEEEAKDDVEAVGGNNVVGLWGPERNVWAGGRPHVDGWEEDGVWRENGWVWGIGDRA